MQLAIVTLSVEVEYKVLNRHKLKNFKAQIFELSEFAACHLTLTKSH